MKSGLHSYKKKKKKVKMKEGQKYGHMNTQ